VTGSPRPLPIAKVIAIVGRDSPLGGNDLDVKRTPRRWRGVLVTGKAVKEPARLDGLEESGHDSLPRES
jgi:hypothetical protein